MNNQEKMVKRLEFLRKNPEVDDSISIMRDLGLISVHYDFRCLNLDRWYLSYRSPSLGYDIHLTSFEADYLRAVWFRCLVLAIADVKTGRPCDCGAWIGDSPPKSMDTCSPALHICAPHARAWLMNLDEEEERFAGLSQNLVRSIVQKIARCGE